MFMLNLTLYFYLTMQEKIYKTLKGSVVRLATHAVASRVLEYAMSNLDKKYVKLLQREFYGNEFSIFDDDIKMASLENILAKKPEKNDNIKHHLEKVLLKAVGKEGVHYAFFQSLLWDYTRLFEEISKDIISGVAGKVERHDSYFSYFIPNLLHVIVYSYICV